MFGLVSRIGRYEVDGEIGRGAMGVVFLAHDPHLQRKIALKTIALPRGLSAERRTEFRERFLREARAAAALSHPGIVTIYDAGQDEDSRRPFIAMEYVPGRTLRDALQAEGPLPPERATQVACDLAAALDAAHAAGIVHRDIKPANVLLGESGGTVKIADFGIARLGVSDLTRAGESLGSPAYMSPEQVRGEELGPASDLFSLAAVLYEALCGERPFGGQDTAAVLYAVAHETPVPISRRVAGLSPAFDAFFDRALAKDPARRFRDGAEFADALRRALHAPALPDARATVVQAALEEPAGRPAAWWRGRRAWAVAAVVALVLGWVAFGPAGHAELKLDVNSAVERGELTIELDGDPVYTRHLDGPRQKRNLFKKILESNHETFETVLDVPAGRHELVARVVVGDALDEYRDTIVLELKRGETRRVRMVAGRVFGQALALKDAGTVEP